MTELLRSIHLEKRSTESRSGRLRSLADVHGDLFRRSLRFSAARLTPSATSGEEKMAQAERPQARQEASAMATDATGMTRDLASSAVAASDAWMQEQAELLENVEQVTHSLLENRRLSIAATRQALAQLQQCRDITDFLRVQNEWLADARQRSAYDLDTVTSMAFGYSRRAMMWLGELMQSSQQRFLRSEEATAGAKPGGSDKG
jgi:hypothetical protein